MARPLSADDLLAGAAAVHKVEIPAALLSGGAGSGNGAIAGEVGLRPLILRDVQRVTQAAKENRVLTSVLMVQQALVEPKLTVEQVARMPAGLGRVPAGRGEPRSAVCELGARRDRGGGQGAAGARLLRACAASSAGRRPNAPS